LPGLVSHRTTLNQRDLIWSQAPPRAPPPTAASRPRIWRPAHGERSAGAGERSGAQPTEGAGPHQQELHAPFDHDRYRQSPLRLQVAAVRPPPTLKLLKVDCAATVFVHLLHRCLELWRALVCVRETVGPASVCGEAAQDYARAPIGRGVQRCDLQCTHLFLLELLPSGFLVELRELLSVELAAPVRIYHVEPLPRGLRGWRRLK
jgi:hypothetical protein